MVVTLSASVYEVIHTNMTPSYYRIINSITQSYVYTWNISVVNILGETDGHGHERDNEFKKKVDMPTIIIVSLYVPTQSYITIKHVMPCHTTPPSIYHN